MRAFRVFTGQWPEPPSPRVRPYEEQREREHEARRESRTEPEEER